MSYTNPNILASGTTFAQLQAGGASGHLEKLITAGTAASANPSVAATISLTGAGQSILNPTVAATVSATGGGQTVSVPTVQATVAVGSATTGSLAAGTYYVGYTFVTPNGETTMGAGSPAASVSAVFTQGTHNTPTVTLPSLASGATTMNVYLSNTNGANTALVLYATGITNTTFILNSSLWNGQTFANGTPPPATNTTTGACVAAATGNYFGYTWVHAHGETTLGASVSTLTTIAAGNVPRVTIPALPTGAVSANIYMSNTNGASTALVLVKTGVTGLTADITAATWNGTTFAAGTSPPTVNTTIGALAPGVYYANFTESDGVGETLISAESSTFTVTSQSNPTAQATVAGSLTTGHLPAGAYLAAYTWVDSNGGETTLGTASATESAAITITAGQVLTVTFNDTLPGWAASRNVYLTVAGGLTTTETLYATGVTTSTYACSSASWLNGTVAASAARGIPTANSTSVDIPRVTFPALQTGNLSRNLYLTLPGGASASESLYATGITGLTFDCAIKQPDGTYGSTKPPTVNTTGYTYTNAAGIGEAKTIELIRSAKDGNLEEAYRYYARAITDFNQGEPMSFAGTIEKLHHAHTCFATLATMCAEAGVLIDANPGHFVATANPIGVTANRRQWTSTGA